MMNKMKGRIAVLLGVMSVAVGCSDVVPLAPSLASSTAAATTVSAAKRSAKLEVVPVLERTRALGQLESTTITIGPEGGEITLPGAGFRMRIPAGALAEPTAISVAAHRGKAVAYEFGPHGIEFLAPVVIEQQLAGTNAERNPRVIRSLGAGYYPGGDASIDDATGTATIIERMGTHMSSDLSTVIFEITHFSGYLIATG